MSDPVTIRFDRANRLLKSRVNLVNTLSSAQLSQKLLPEMRMHAFFSAGVGSARVIEKLREVSDDYTTGKMNLADARLKLKEWLFDHAEKNPGDAALIDRLATTARLNLILDQNRANAAAVAQYELDSDPDVVALLPYKRITPTTSRNPRESHKHLEGLILPASHPYWHTHTPPTDFNCKHGVELIDEDEAAAAGYTGKETAEKNGKKDVFGRDIWTYADAGGRKHDVPLPESGFELNVHAPFETVDLGTLGDAEIRRDILEKLESFCFEKDLVAVVQSSERPAIEKFSGFRGKEADRKGLSGAIVKVNGAMSDARKNGTEPVFPKVRVSLGSIPQETALSLGIKAEDTEMFFSSPGNSKYGVTHWNVNHEETLTPEKVMTLFSKTIWNQNAKIKIELDGKNKLKRIVFVESDTEESPVSTLIHTRNGWEFEVVDAWFAPVQYIKSTLKKGGKK